MGLVLTNALDSNDMFLHQMHNYTGNVIGECLINFVSKIIPVLTFSKFNSLIQLCKNTKQFWTWKGLLVEDFRLLIEDKFRIIQRYNKYYFLFSIQLK